MSCWSVLVTSMTILYDRVLQSVQQARYPIRRGRANTARRRRAGANDDARGDPLKPRCAAPDASGSPTPRLLGPKGSWHPAVPTTSAPKGCDTALIA